MTFSPKKTHTRTQTQKKTLKEETDVSQGLRTGQMHTKNTISIAMSATEEQLSSTSAAAAATGSTAATSKVYGKSSTTSTAPLDGVLARKPLTTPVNGGSSMLARKLANAERGRILLARQLEQQQQLWTPTV